MNHAEIMEATTGEDYAVGRTLIEEYAAALGIDLCFQNFSEEISSLHISYGPPRGFLLLARVSGKVVGCVAVRNQSGTACEMKRLYVRLEYRRSGLGRRLAEMAIRNAQKLCYAKMVLDTLPSMTAAQSLYGSLGFREVEGDYPKPVQDVHNLALELTNSEKTTA